MAMAAKPERRSVQDAETIAEHMPDTGKADLRLWLRLLACTNMIEAEIRGRLRQTFDVTLPRFDLMAQLEREPEGLRLSDLSRRMMVSNGNVTGLVDRLAGEGMIERIASQEDRRVFRVKLTKEGRAAFQEMAKVHEGWVADMFADLEPEDVDRLMSQLRLLKSSVTRSQEEKTRDRNS